MKNDFLNEDGGAEVNVILNNIQNEIKVPRGRCNEFGKFMYRSSEDILEAVKPILYKYKCALWIEDELLVYESKTYISAIVHLRFPNGITIKTIAYARESETKKGMDSSQITLSASSYARKCALSGLLLLDASVGPQNNDEMNNLPHTLVDERNKKEFMDGWNGYILNGNTAFSSGKIYRLNDEQVTALRNHKSFRGSNKII